MGEFWEDAFQSKQLMWGEEPSAFALDICATFKQNGFERVLIPGFGYGRNAKPFYEHNFDVVGIEISDTAIGFAKRLHGDGIKVFHGSVNDMPFDSETYDGIYCHALIHLLDSTQRAEFLAKCHAQLRSGGMMVFTAVTKNASMYGKGERIGPDRYRTKDGVDLFFYDLHSIQEEFGRHGSVDAIARSEKNGSEFWIITCRKNRGIDGLV